MAPVSANATGSPDRAHTRCSRTATAEGYQGRAAADFERCLQLGGTDLRDDDLFARLIALAGYYFVHADLRRAAQVFESLRAGIEQPALVPPGDRERVRGGGVAPRRVRCRPLPISSRRRRTWPQLTRDHIDAVCFMPNDPIATAHIHMAWTRGLCGDLDDAEAELAHAARRANEVGFPQGPFSLAYARLVEIWIRVDAGQLDRAAVRGRRPERIGRTARLRHTGDWRAAIIGALAALGADATPIRGGRQATLTAWMV